MLLCLSLRNGLRQVARAQARMQVRCWTILLEPDLLTDAFADDHASWKDSQENQDIYCMKKYGHVHGGFIGGIPILYVSEPSLVKQILVKDFHVFPNRKPFGNMEKDKLLGKMLTALTGEKWKIVRNTLTPTYTSGKLKQMVYLIEEASQYLINSLKNKAENGEPIEFIKSFSVLTLDVIASCAFGMKSDCIDNQESEFVHQANKAFRPSPKLIYFVNIMPFLIQCIPKFLPNPFDYFQKIADRTIDMRQNQKDFSRKDFLQIMLEAEIPSDASNETEEDKNLQKETKKTLTRDVVIAQTVLFILAGHETTTNTLTFLAYELALDQDLQEKLIKEVDDVMTNCKGKLTYEDVKSMQFLEMVVAETLRKYPPAVRTDRVCVEDEYNLDGIIMKKGIEVGIPIYAIHHNPEFYSNPQIFDPERFSAENKAKRNPFTYLPFGAGPRNCIAMRFALLEIKLVIAHMLCNYRFQTCPETQFPVQFDNRGMGLLQPKSVKLTLQMRIDQPKFN
uniref:Cytochrome P450 n=1 Tax=Strigamia maritima TaxID=126957 RepID=T1J343_STRMM